MEGESPAAEEKGGEERHASYTRNPLLRLRLKLPQEGLRIQNTRTDIITYSVPVLDCERPDECYVDFMIEGVSPEVQSAFDGRVLRLSMVPRYDGNGDSFPVLPADGKLPQLLPETLRIETRMDEAGGAMLALVGRMLFPHILKAPEQNLRYRKSHVPVRLQFVGRSMNGDLLLVTNVSQGFLMRGKQVKNSSERGPAAIEPEPPISLQLEEELYTGIDQRNARTIPLSRPPMPKLIFEPEFRAPPPVVEPPRPVTPIEGAFKTLTEARQAWTKLKDFLNTSVRRGAEDEIVGAKHLAKQMVDHLKRSVLEDSKQVRAPAPVSATKRKRVTSPSRLFSDGGSEMERDETVTSLLALRENSAGPSLTQQLPLVMPPEPLSAVATLTQAQRHYMNSMIHSDPPPLEPTGSMPRSFQGLWGQQIQVPILRDISRAPTFEGQSFPSTLSYSGSEGIYKNVGMDSRGFSMNSIRPPPLASHSNDFISRTDSAVQPSIVPS